MRKRSLTPFGLDVKKRLLELGLTQKEFCLLNDISETRFSEILYGVLPGREYVKRIAKKLDIKISS